MPVDYARATWSWIWARFGPRPDREEGLTTTEVAVLTFMLVGAAIVVAGIIYQAAKTSAERIPDPGVPLGPGGAGVPKPE